MQAPCRDATNPLHHMRIGPLLPLGMFLFQIILIFVVIPAAMIAISAATGPAGARIMTYVIFPVVLLLFAVVSHIRTRGEHDPEDPST